MSVLHPTALLETSACRRPRIVRAPCGKRTMHSIKTALIECIVLFPHGARTIRGLLQALVSSRAVGCKTDIDTGKWFRKHDGRRRTAWAVASAIHPAFRCFFRHETSGLSYIFVISEVA